MKQLIKQVPFSKQTYNQLKKASNLIPKQLLEAVYKREFESDCYGCFWGVFETFEQAMQAAPRTKSVGYDNEELAQDYQQMLEDNNWENSGCTIRPHDYPVLFWLKVALSEGANRVFDFGGNVGVHYYIYARYLNYADDLEWKVCDLPEIIKAGKVLAQKRAAQKLSFTDDFSDIKGHDVFIASGSIQYVEDLAQTLTKQSKPTHLLINRLPLYDGERFVTLQNGGKVFYPQYVFNKTDFIKALESLGYELIDLWEDRGSSCMIPCHPDRSIRFYHGMYLKQKHQSV